MVPWPWLNRVHSGQIALLHLMVKRNYLWAYATADRFHGFPIAIHFRCRWMPLMLSSWYENIAINAFSVQFVQLVTDRKARRYLRRAHAPRQEGTPGGKGSSRPSRTNAGGVSSSLRIQSRWVAAGAWVDGLEHPAPLTQTHTTRITIYCQVRNTGIQPEYFPMHGMELILILPAEYR